MIVLGFILLMAVFSFALGESDGNETDDYDLFFPEDWTDDGSSSRATDKTGH